MREAWSDVKIVRSDAPSNLHPAAPHSASYIRNTRNGHGVCYNLTHVFSGADLDSAASNRRRKVGREEGTLFLACFHGLELAPSCLLWQLTHHVCRVAPEWESARRIRYAEPAPAEDGGEEEGHAGWERERTGEGNSALDTSLADRR